jgi:citrate lyase subunit gamma (acyl carrier protein)
MEIEKTSVAGTLESSDVLITIEPAAAGIEIDLKSDVEKQFGALIRRVILETLAELQVTKAKIIAVDKGALDCVIIARIKTAVYRSSSKRAYEWKV